MHPTVNIAVRAARAAGDVILRYHNQVDILTIENKSINDFVSEVDKTAEKAIINEIKKAFPKHSILAEESGKTLGDDDFLKLRRAARENQHAKDQAVAAFGRRQPDHLAAEDEAPDPGSIPRVQGSRIVGPMVLCWEKVA